MGTPTGKTVNPQILIGCLLRQSAELCGGTIVNKKANFDFVRIMFLIYFKNMFLDSDVLPATKNR